jgi:hypothetical protein
MDASEPTTIDKIMKTPMIAMIFWLRLIFRCCDFFFAISYSFNQDGMIGIDEAAA